MVVRVNPLGVDRAPAALTGARLGAPGNPPDSRAPAPSRGSRAHEQGSCLLFVYGSLKRGRSNHHELGAAEFVAAAHTAPCFALRVISGYPALVPGASAIFGELYRIAEGALPALDEFEGPAYVREAIELGGGERAQAYLARVPGAGVPYLADEWPTEGV